MRIWSIHPRYLDRQGLIALWREGLLAQKVLAGKTKGYKHHPQLIRFRESSNPLALIGQYLLIVALEAEERGYKFDKTKILKTTRKTISVSRGQLKFERLHLLRKLKVRDPRLEKLISKKKTLRSHPLFRSVRGNVHHWERL